MNECLTPDVQEFWALLLKTEEKVSFYSYVAIILQLSISEILRYHRPLDSVSEQKTHHHATSLQIKNC